MKKFLTLFLTICMAIIACFTTACDRSQSNPGGGDIIVDKTKTQLYIGVYDGGIGDNWIRPIAKAFEEKYKDYRIGDKVGVEIVPHPTRSYSGAITQIDSLLGEVIFGEHIDYMGLAREGKVLDISDIVSGSNSSLADYGDSSTIADKLSKEQKDYLNFLDGKYYGVPFYEGGYELTYDKTLFCEKGLFFDENNEIIDEKGTIDRANGTFTLLDSTVINLGTGPDGVSKTYDDGLPRTYEEFFVLCTKLRLLNIIPVGWCGQYYNMYLNLFLDSLIADYEGYDNYKLNFTMSGTADDLIDTISGDTVSLMPSTQISVNNAYLLKRQSGVYSSLKFLFELLSHSNNYDANICFSKSSSNTLVQKQFLLGKHVTSSSYKPIGMLIDGTWWYNECRDAVVSANSNYGESEYEVMPIPKASVDKLGVYTPLAINAPFCVIKSSIDSSKIELAKEFVKFFYTNKSLSQFLSITSIPIGVNFRLDGITEDGLSTYAKSTWNKHKNTQTVTQLSGEPCAINNFYQLYDYTREHTSLVDTGKGYQEYNNFSELFRDYGLEGFNIDARAYLEGIWRYNSKENWEKRYSEYFK